MGEAGKPRGADCRRSLGPHPDRRPTGCRTPRSRTWLPCAQGPGGPPSGQRGPGFLRGAPAHGDGAAPRQADVPHHVCRSGAAVTAVHAVDAAGIMFPCLGAQIPSRCQSDAGSHPGKGYNLAWSWAQPSPLHYRRGPPQRKQVRERFATGAWPSRRKDVGLNLVLLWTRGDSRARSRID